MVKSTLYHGAVCMNCTDIQVRYCRIFHSSKNCTRSKAKHKEHGKIEQYREEKGVHKKLLRYNTENFEDKVSVRQFRCDAE